MTTKKFMTAAGLLLGASLAMTTASFAQAYYYGSPSGQGYYDYAPGYGSYYYGGARSDCSRGGPGPRIGCGSGAGIGAQR